MLAKRKFSWSNFDLLATDAAPRTKRERVRSTKLVSAVLLVQPTFRKEFVRLFEVPLAVRCSPHGHRNRCLQRCQYPSMEKGLMKATYTSGDEMAINSVASLGNRSNKPNRSAREDPESLVNDS